MMETEQFSPNPNRLPLRIIDAADLTWTGNRGACDASDLPRDTVRRVYRDACDVGFIVRSPRTGRKVLFTHREDVYHGAGEDRELVAQVFGEDDGLDLTITLFND